MLLARAQQQSHGDQQQQQQSNEHEKDSWATIASFYLCVSFFIFSLIVLTFLTLNNMAIEDLNREPQFYRYNLARMSMFDKLAILFNSLHVSIPFILLVIIQKRCLKVEHISLFRQHKAQSTTTTPETDIPQPLSSQNVRTITVDSGKHKRVNKTHDQVSELCIEMRAIRQKETGPTDEEAQVTTIERASDINTHMHSSLSLQEVGYRANDLAVKRVSTSNRPLDVYENTGENKGSETNIGQTKSSETFVQSANLRRLKLFNLCQSTLSRTGRYLNAMERTTNDSPGTADCNQDSSTLERDPNFGQFPWQGRDLNARRDHSFPASYLNWAHKQMNNDKIRRSALT